MKKINLNIIKFLIVFILLFLGLTVLVFNKIGTGFSHIQNSEDDSNFRVISDTSVRVNPFTDLNIEETKLIQSQDSLIKELVSLIKTYEKELKRGGSVTNVINNTYIKDTLISVVYDIDTTIIDSIVYLEPSYRTSVIDKWYKLNMRNTNSTTYIDSLIIFNKYNIIQGVEKYGFLKLQKRNFVEFQSLNPYSKTTDIKTYIVNNKKPKIYLGVGVFGGYNYSSKNEPNINFTYGIGFNLSYKLLEF